jgi:hypothetical protein
VDFEDASSYADALRALKSYNLDEVNRLRRNGYETVKLHTLAYERERFGEFMDRLTNRLDRLGPGSRTLDVSRDGR